MRPLPDHWLMNPMQRTRNMRYRLPLVLTMDFQVVAPETRGLVDCYLRCLDNLRFSLSIAARISSYSSRTSSVSLPSPWYRFRAASASSSRSLDMSHRGDSGRNQMVDNWSTLGAIWRSEGSLQDQVLGIRRVPKVIQAAAMLPRNQL